MSIVADLQLHSKYSRAVSKDMVIPVMARWGKKKGIDLLATGDWMHTLWLRELQAQLAEVDEGIFVARDDPDGARFLLSAEISSIYSEGGKGRRVHTLVFVPSFAAAEKINEKLLARGCNLLSDGRPIVGLSCKEIAEIVFSVEERALVIPAHAWTPWFALYGSKSGFDSVEECFGEWSERIYAIETGLSSDPLMNWRVADVERRAVVSFSDAHSPVKLGREATVFLPKNGIENEKLKMKNYTYSDIYGAIAERFTGKNEGNLRIGYTIEFYPEEGKYHWTGHRACNVKQSPDETRKLGTTCPVCGRGLTIGVEHRVEQVAQLGMTNSYASQKLGRSFSQAQNDKLQMSNNPIEPLRKKNKYGVIFNYHPADATRPPYVMLVPLYEVISEVFEVGVGSKKVVGVYENLVERFGDEFTVLLRTPIEELERAFGGRIAEAVKKVREQDIAVDPGYDGEFGKVAIWAKDGEDRRGEGTGKQMGLF